MYEETYFSGNCPERRALSLISERWIGPAVLTLSGGPMRYNAIRRALPGVSQRMLTRALRRLESEGLLTRHEEASVPPKVTYTLTARGQGFKPLLENVAAWGKAEFGPENSTASSRP